MTVDDPVPRWSAASEGQFYDRTSVFDRKGGKAKPRKVADVARGIVETLSAMANADGGELVVGLEDDGTPTGVPYPADRMALLLRAPKDRNYVTPLLPCQAREVKTADGKALLHFVVEWSPEVHSLADGRYLLRVHDQTLPRPADEIAALKHTKSQGLFERSYPPSATTADLDMALVTKAVARMGLTISNEEFLRKYRLVEPRNGHGAPCLTGLLLFGADPLRWHPRCGIDFVRWNGTERKHGAELNIERRVRLEHPLAVLVEKAHEAILPHIRERQQLVDLFFTERLEYPTFAWQEAIVNAVAHRDYSIQGASIEVWMFDDRIEVRSPGLPPRPVTVEALNRHEFIHVSRNPLLVRVLADLGLMRELGEGISRMFAEMEREGFYPPRFADLGGVTFQVTLRNEPIYDAGTLEWLRGYERFGLSGDQKRILARARAHGDRFTSKDYQEQTGLDIYGASASIKDMIRKGAARSTGKRSRVYQVLPADAGVAPTPDEWQALLPRLRKQGAIRNSDVREVLGVDRRAATKLLARLVSEGRVVQTGERRGTRYEPAGPI